MHWKHALLVLFLTGACTVSAFARDEEGSLEPRYISGNRRDPFLRHSVDDAFRSAQCRGQGAESLRVQDLVLSGVVRGSAAPVALVSGPLGTTHFLHVGDRLCDGVVISIGPAALTLRGPGVASLVRRSLRPE